MRWSSYTGSELTEVIAGHDVVFYRDALLCQVLQRQGQHRRETRAWLPRALDQGAKAGAEGFGLPTEPAAILKFPRSG